MEQQDNASHRIGGRRPARCCVRRNGIHERVAEKCVGQLRIWGQLEPMERLVSRTGNIDMKRRWKLLEIDVVVPAEHVILGAEQLHDRRRSRCGRIAIRVL